MGSHFSDDFDVNACGIARQIGQRHVLTFDDLKGFRLRAGCNRLFTCLGLGFGQCTFARASINQRKDAIRLAADLGNCRANSIGNREILWSNYL